MKKQEAAFTTKFKRWALKHLETCAVEVKHTRGSPSFDMRELKDHQRLYLTAVRSKKGIAYKIPDDGVSYKPFDFFILKNKPAYVAIAYPEVFVVLPILNTLDWQKPRLPLSDALLFATFTGRLSDLK